MEGFHGPDLVLGSIYGVRHFGWTEHGLKAVSHDYRWTSGENEAVCKAPPPHSKPIRHLERKRSCVAQHGDSHSGAFLDWLVDNNLPLPPGVQECFVCETFDPPPHGPVAKPECQCGFWAYYGEGLDSPYASQNRIAGVIEGYGRTTIGTKGFRCEKAKIVALMVPPPASKDPEPEPFDQSTAFEDELRFHRGRWWSVKSRWEVRDILRARRVHTREECDDPYSHGRYGMLCYPRGQKNSHYGRTYRDYSKREREVVERQRSGRPRWTDGPLSLLFRSVYPWAGAQECVPVEDVAALYPDVPIFHSMEAMLREFPTEKPDFTEDVA